MTPRLKTLLLLSSLALMPSELALAQQPARPVAAVPAPVAQQAAPAVQQAPPAVQAQPQAAPLPLPPPLWTVADAQQLLLVIQSVGREGLDPNDYDPAGLITALRSGDPMLMSYAATDRFRTLSGDLALGHVRGDDRQNWLIPDNDLDEQRQDLLLRTAVQSHRVGEALQSLLPTHPQYAALKHALEVTPRSEADKINRIRLNLDRWRWLPRDLGDRYIIVNVPAFTAALVENGETVSRHVAVAGATKTPTPQLMATATGVVLNPSWYVPKSIESDVRGKAGYLPVKNKDGKITSWRQPPGPRNALGQIKFVMPNPEAIYLHDTNARGLFDTKNRAYSHGCIRTEHIMLLAERLLTDGGTGEWTPEKIKAALASKKTVEASFPKPLPVYIVYMSSAALQDGSIKDYADIYKRDGKVIAALNDKSKPVQPAEPKKEVAAR